MLLYSYMKGKLPHLLHYLWCTLSQVPSIQPTSDLNQSLPITSIFSSSPISLFLTLGNLMFCLVLSDEFLGATLRADYWFLIITARVIWLSALRMSSSTHLHLSSDGHSWWHVVQKMLTLCRFWKKCWESPDETVKKTLYHEPSKQFSALLGKNADSQFEKDICSTLSLS